MRTRLKCRRAELRVGEDENGFRRIPCWCRTWWISRLRVGFVAVLGVSILLLPVLLLPVLRLFLVRILVS